MSDSKPGIVSLGGDSGGKTFHCGTLTYTKVALAATFAWLLWGDFCFTLMESVVPTLLPLKLKAYNTPNSVMALIMTTAPGILTIAMGPYVSVKSDRHRGRWGRRIPFILWTLPFLCASLVLLGYSEPISAFLQSNIRILKGFAPITVTIGVVAVVYTMFRFFNVFVSSVFYYLFNDVVPPQYLARFYAAFRIVGTLAGSFYNFFVFRFSESHMREIFLGAAVLYFFGFGLMCLRVKEGQYPPVEEKPEGAGMLEGISAFFRESFTSKFYLGVFFFAAFGGIGGTISAFGVFFNLEMGLSLEQIGQIGGVAPWASAAAIAVTAAFIDRWHPLRVTVYVAVFTIIHSFMPWVWIFITLPGNIFFWMLLGWIIISQFQGGLSGASGMPLYMRVFPQSRFGQFCSAQGLLITAFSLLTSLLAGMFIDFVSSYCSYPDFGYRFIFVWTTVFAIASAASIVIAYRKWHALGGDADFHPPAPWAESGIERVPVVTTIGPQTRWLNLAFRCFDLIMLFTLVASVVILTWMHRNGFPTALWSNMLLVLAAIIAAACWAKVSIEIQSDIAKVERGEQPRLGIPHHGVLLVVAIKFLFGTLIWVIQVFVSLKMGKAHDAFIFSLGNIIVNFALIGGVYFLCWIERGYSFRVDQNLATSSE